MSVHDSCEGFPLNCPNLVDVQSMQDTEGAFACGCTEAQRAQSRLRSGLADVPSMMEALGQSIATTNALFVELAKLVLGEEGATVHACPQGESEVMPCCMKSPGDVPATDRITEDPADVTCRGGFHGSS